MDHKLSTQTYAGLPAREFPTFVKARGGSNHPT